MRFVIALLFLLLLISGCTSVPEAPGIGSDELAAIEARYGKEARERVQSWRQLIEANKSQQVPAKLEMTNRFFNRLVFEDDSVHWGMDDYWATPVETLATNGGDCEDFSVGKYFTLKELGVDDQCLRLTYVKALTLNKAHMVLTYQCNNSQEPLVLDNIVTEIMASPDRSDLLPVYSFNANGLWLAKQQGMGKQVGDSGRLSLWVELLQRMNQPPAAAQPSGGKPKLAK